MSAQPNFRNYLTEEEYLAMERQAEHKSEYLNGAVFPLHQPVAGVEAMAGASNFHNVIVTNIITDLGHHLRRRDWTVRASDVRLQVSESGLYTYPNVSVVCGIAEFRPDAYLDTLLNPVVLIEVLARSTSAHDRGSKFMHYQTIPSLRHYLLVSSNEWQVMCCAHLEDNAWTFTNIF